MDALGNGRPAPAPRSPPRAGGAFIGIGVAGSDDGGGGRLIFSRGENYRHVRRQEILDRWPVLPEEWAEGIERARLAPSA